MNSLTISSVIHEDRLRKHSMSILESGTQSWTSEQEQAVYLNFAEKEINCSKDRNTT